MRQLPLLIKQRESEIEEQRAQKARLDAQIAALKASMARLDQSLQAEADFISAHMELRDAYSQYAIEVAEKKRLLQEELVQCITQEEQLREILYEMYGDVKRLEHVLQQQQLQAQQKERQLETQEMDDIGGRIVSTSQQQESR